MTWNYAAMKASGICTCCRKRAAKTPHAACEVCLEKRRGGNEQNKMKRPATKPRNCLRCEKSFPSEGPHNRLCNACREWIATSETPTETVWTPFTFV